MNTCDNCGNALKKSKQKGCKHLFCDMKCRDKFRAKQIPTFQCDFCGNLVKKQKAGNHVFCSIPCKTAFGLRKYDSLITNFQTNPNEAAYLFGLILGDGHLKKSGACTTRVSIAFNLSDTAGLTIAEQVMSILGIKYFIEPKTPNNCKTLGFILPNNLLQNYGLLYHGNKFGNQPKCPSNVKENINFAIGLLNSDGNLYEGDRNKMISFNNTTESIVCDMKSCLSHNHIEFREYKHEYKNKNWKRRITIAIMQEASRAKILACRYCKWRS
jgi:hypothetical protein